MQKFFGLPKKNIGYADLKIREDWLRRAKGSGDSWLGKE